MVDHDSGSSDAARGGVAYRRAGLAYGVLGAVILVVTVASPGLAQPERRADIAHLLAGLPFFALFALAIAYGNRAFAALARGLGASTGRADRVGDWMREKLVMLLTLSGLGRTAVFLGNAVGHRPRLRSGPWRFELDTVEADPRMWINALLMATICGFLVRSAWLPAWRRWRGEPGENR